MLSCYIEQEGTMKKTCFNCKYCEYEIETNEHKCANKDSLTFNIYVDESEDYCDNWEQSAIRWYKEEEE